MNAERDDPLSDAALDRAIEEALAVDPSPAFLARVRERLAEEPAPAAWRGTWLLLTAGALAATALLAIGVGRALWTPVSTDGETPVLAGSPIADGAVLALPSAPRTRAFSRLADAETTVVARRDRSREPAASLPAPAEPEVQVSADEAAALRRLFAAVQAGGFDLSVLGGPAADGGARSIARIVIRPIALTPIAETDRDEGARR